MVLLIGMDEAGLGPNLGPFVVAATVWEVPESELGFDFWTAFDTVLTREPASGDQRLHIADSKRVFQPQKGLGALERGLWSALRLMDWEPVTFDGLCRRLSPQYGKLNSGAGRKTVAAKPRRGSLFEDSELSAARSPGDTHPIESDHLPLPWYETDLQLPLTSPDLQLVKPWQRRCEQLKARLVSVHAEIVEPLRFNRLVRRFDNKAQATSRLAMNLLRSIWEPDDCPALIVADKHGGRNRYDMLLADTFSRPVTCVAEGAELSIYRVGQGELRFQPRAEDHGPVALASMTAKYVREVAMHQFNRFWQACLPGLKPTQGYPTDAKRFRGEIATEQRRLRIADDLLWRER